MTHTKNTSAFSMSNIASRSQLVILPLLGLCLLPSCSSVDDPTAPTNTVDTVIASNNTHQSAQTDDTAVWKGSTAATPVAKPVVAKPVVTKPVVAKPVATKPVVSKPVVAKPVVTKPVVSKPVVAKPIVNEPVTPKSVAVKPVVAKPAPEKLTIMPTITKSGAQPVATKQTAQPTATQPVAQPTTNRAPYDSPAFKAALDDSKLQAPNSSTLAKRGKLPGFSHECFYLSEDGRMTFVTDHSSVRSELRQMEEWVTGSTTPKEMEGRVLLDAPTANMSDDYTFMQIHDSLKVPNAPLIRLEWRQDYRGKDDHIWATIRTKIMPKEYLKVDLGARPDRAFLAKISVVNNQLSVSIDNQTIIKAHDVSHWDGLSSYYKAGAYSRGSGTVKVAFETLKYSY